MTEIDQRFEEQEEFEIDLREILQVLLKWKWLIIALTILAVATSGLMSYFVLPPVYQTRTQLLVRQASAADRSVSKDISDIEDVVDTVSSIPQMTMQNYVSQVKNQTLLNKVIDQLELDKDIYNASSLGRMISVSDISNTNMIQITVTNSDPNLAAKVANTLSEEYVKFITDTIQQQMNQSVNFMQELINKEEIELEVISKKLRNFQAQPKSVDFLDSEVSSVTANIAAYRSKYYALQVELERYNTGVARIFSQLEEVPETLTYEEVAPAPLADGSTIVEVEKPNPEYSALVAKLQERQVLLIERQAELASVERVTQSLKRELVGLQSELAEKRAQQNNLQRELDRREQTYALLLEKMTQTQLAQSIDIGQNSLQVMSPAVTPVSPIKPNKKLNIAIAAVLGVMLSVFLAFALEFFDTSVKSAEDLQKRTGLPVLGSVPVYEQNTR